MERHKVNLDISKYQFDYKITESDGEIAIIEFNVTKEIDAPNSIARDYNFKVKCKVDKNKNEIMEREILNPQNEQLEIGDGHLFFFVNKALCNEKIIHEF